MGGSGSKLFTTCMERWKWLNQVLIIASSPTECYYICQDPSMSGHLENAATSFKEASHFTVWIVLRFFWLGACWRPHARGSLLCVIVLQVQVRVTKLQERLEEVQARSQVQSGTHQNATWRSCPSRLKIDRTITCFPFDSGILLLACFRHALG